MHIVWVQRGKIEQRPIKIVMKTKSNKAEFMSKLWKLKYADCFDGKIRVTDDFTYNIKMEVIKS